MRGKKELCCRIGRVQENERTWNNTIQGTVMKTTWVKTRWCSKYISRLDAEYTRKLQVLKYGTEVCVVFVGRII